MKQRVRFLVRVVLGPVLLLGTVPGCETFHAYRPLPIQLIDAETKQPIPGAEVHIAYPLANAAFAPHEARGNAGPDGIAHLQAAPYGPAGVQVEVSAQGYLAEEKYLTIENVQAIKPAHFFEDVSKRSPAIVIEVMAGPKPSIELVVPSGYRGLIKARLQIRNDAELPRGQRRLSYPVSATGEAAIVGPPLLQRVQPCDIHAQSEEGPLPNRPTDPLAIGFWWLKSENNVHSLFIGTVNEYDAERRALLRDNTTGSQPASPGKGAGKGRHGRHG